MNLKQQIINSKNFRMKKLIFFTMLFISIQFISCDIEDEIIEDPSELTEGCYIYNQGSFGEGGASISKYDYVNDEMTNFYYQQQNNGTELLSNLQYVGTHSDSVYFIGNAPDELITVNKLFKQSRNSITDQIYNPRFCVGNGDYLYISCLGETLEWTNMANSYIAVLNLKTNSIVKTIDLPGGPEGLEIAKGKLYAALNYKDSVAVINLSNDHISYIETPAVSSYFLKDNKENLYVTLVSTYSDFSMETGIGYINTASERLTETFPIDNVSGGYGTIMTSNDDFSKIYLVTSSYDSQYNLTGAVSVFNVNTKEFEAEPIVNNISGITSIAYNKKYNHIYVLSAPSTTGAGSMKIYSETGSFYEEYAVGAYPVGAFFLD